MNSNELKLIKKGLEEALNHLDSAIEDIKVELEDDENSLLVKLSVEEQIKGIEEGKENIKYAIADIDDWIADTEYKEREAHLEPKGKVVEELLPKEETLPKEPKIEEKEEVKEVVEAPIEKKPEQKPVKKPLSKDEKKKYRINPYMDVKSLQKGAKKTYRIK